MLSNSVTPHPGIHKYLLIVIGIILAAVIIVLDRRRSKRIKRMSSPSNIPNSKKTAQPFQGSLDPSTPSLSTGTPAFRTLEKRHWMLADLFRVLLIILSLVVAAGFILILLPQPSIDKFAQNLQARQSAGRQEKIAFLYLGDEITNNELHVRGVVRNITTAPIEQLDAVVRFYSQDRTLLETTIVRANKETIAPDEIAQFELVYPNYRMEFGSYSAEFKLRQGDPMPYKDMRTSQARPN
jgi:hypothetical protein